MNKKAFTLAEILITLTVIGVVAALTIPTLLQSTDGAETKAALKKLYSDLTQATTIIRTEYNGNLMGAFSSLEGLENAYRDRLSYVKECIPGEIAGNCMASIIYPYNSSTADTTTIPSTTAMGLILSSGSSIAFTSQNSACSGTGKCGDVVVDINGLKTPNKIGKDIFIFEIDHTRGLIPGGADTSSYSTTGSDACNAASGTGKACAASFLFN